jgi:hypothetical protein
MEDDFIYINFFFKRKILKNGRRPKKIYIIHNDEDKETDNSEFTSSFNRCLEQLRQLDQQNKLK